MLSQQFDERSVESYTGRWQREKLRHFVLDGRRRSGKRVAFTPARRKH